MACLTGHIPWTAPGIYQLEIDAGVSGNIGPAFILGADGRCWINRDRLEIFAKMPLPKAPKAMNEVNFYANALATTLVARSALAAEGDGIPEPGIELLRPKP